MKIEPLVRKANYYETDQMAIVHHSNYIRWFEEARVDYMDKIGYGYDKAVAEGIDFAVLSVNCEYKSMVRFNEVVNIKTTVTAITPTRISLSYTVTDAKTGKIRTTGNSSHCYFDNNSGRPVILSRRMPELYQLFCDLCEAKAKQKAQD